MNNDNTYINPNYKLLTEMAKLSKYELHVLSKNYKKFIDNIKTRDKIKQSKNYKKFIDNIKTRDKIKQLEIQKQEYF